jgi:p21-activated kinase 1
LINKDKQSNQEQEKEMEISGPYNAKHVTHVGFDASTGEFTGLPQEWQTLIQHSGITKVEQYQNPQVKHKATFSVKHSYSYCKKKKK